MTQHFPNLKRSGEMRMKLYLTDMRFHTLFCGTNAQITKHSQLHFKLTSGNRSGTGIQLRHQINTLSLLALVII